MTAYLVVDIDVNEPRDWDGFRRDAVPARVWWANVIVGEGIQLHRDP